MYTNVHFPAYAASHYALGGSGASSSQLARQLKAEEYSLRNRLRSIADDRRFVEEVCATYSRLAVFANLSCGIWYLADVVAARAAEPVYFKSTDGHAHHWKFSDTRLNAHLLRTIIEGRTVDGGKIPGALIVDSTRKGKKFPDSFSRTIPIWCAVWNRAIHQFRQAQRNATSASEEEELAWDIALHMPTWVSAMECSQIETRLPGFVATLLNSGVDLASIARGLRKPLRCLWYDRTSAGWADGDASFDELAFTPLLLVQPSRVESETRGLGQRQGWSYVQGAGDDEENWLHAYGCRGFTAGMLSAHARELDQLDYEEEVVERVREIVAEAKAKKQMQGDKADAASALASEAITLKLHRIELLGVYVLISGAVPSVTALEGQIKSSHSLNASPALLYLYFDATQAMKQQRRAKLAADQERKWHREQGDDEEEEESEEQHDSVSNEQAPVSPSSAVASAGWPMDRCLALPISSLAKAKTALLDLLTPAIEFLSKQVAGERTTVIVCEDVSFISCLCAAALLRRVGSTGADSDAPAAAAPPTLTSGPIDKVAIRAALASVQAFLPSHFPSRLLLKQLNAFFMHR